MSVYAYMPPINPLRFVEKGISFTDEHGHKPYGEASFLDSLSNSEVAQPYFQPFKKNGQITLQFHVAATTAINLKFYSADTKALLHTVAISNPPLTLSTLIVPGTEDEQLYIQKIQVSPSSYSQLDDYDLVWVEIELNFDGTYKYLLSTVPIYLFTDNDEYSKIVYTNNTNDYDVFWENKNPLYYPVFEYYIEADRMHHDTAFEHTTYDEMNGKVEELHSNVTDIFTFKTAFVPEYALDILDRALACDNKQIDGATYTLKEVGEAEGKTLKSKEYVLTNPDDTLKHTFRQADVTLWERPASGYPYAVGNLTLLDAAGRSIQLDARIFDASGDETALIAVMDARAASAGSTGSFSESSGVFIFTNGEGETFSVASDVQVMDTEVSLDITVGTSSSTHTHLSAFADNFDHYHIINFGEGSTITYDELWLSSSGIINASKLYASTGNYTIRIFHKNEDIIFNANKTVSTAPLITDVTGSFSSLLERVYFRNHDFSGLAAIDLAFIAPAKDTLNTLVIANCGLDAITAGWASGLVVGTPPNWYRPFYKIAYIDLSANTLSATELDAFCNELHGSTRWQPGFKTLNIKFQTPLAPPTGSSLTARNAFAAAGWQVFTD